MATQIFLLAARPYDMPDESDPSKAHNTGVSIKFISGHTDPNGAVNGHDPMKASLPMAFAEQLMKAQLPAVCEVELEMKNAAGGKAGVTFSSIKFLRSITFTSLISAAIPKQA